MVAVSNDLVTGDEIVLTEPNLTFILDAHR